MNADAARLNSGRRRSRIGQIAWTTATLISLALVVLVFVRAVHGIEFDELRPEWLVVSTALFGISWVGFAVAWSMLTGERDRLGQMAMWVRSQLLRYLPGAIWAPMARAINVSGARSRKIVTVGAEALIFLTTAISIGSLFAGFFVTPWFLCAIVAPVAALALISVVGARCDVTARNATAACLWLLPSWLTYAFASVAAQAAVGPVPGVGRVAAASLLAWAAGFVAVFAPGGAGVREVVYGWILAGAAPAGTLAGGAVAGRLAFTVSELVVAGALVAASRGMVRRHDRTRRG